MLLRIQFPVVYSFRLYIEDDSKVNTQNCLMFAWPYIIDMNDIDNQLDATITAY